MYCIYIFQHKQNHKIYVGKTKDFRVRLNKHKSAMKSPKTYFSKALAKHGLDQFNYFVIEEWDNEIDTSEAEQFWIAFFNSTNKELGYNLTKGGEGSIGFRHSPESIAKLKIVNATKTLGRKHSPESIKLMSEKQLRNHNKNSFMNSGERNPNSKLTEIDVIEIRKLISKSEISQKDIMKIFNISPATLWRISSRRSWKNLP